MIKNSLLTLFLLVTVFVSGCSDQAVSPEDEVRNYIKRGVEAAESRSAGDLAEMIYDSYLDHKGLGKQQTVKLLRLYFFKHKNIFLFTKIREITFPTANEATVSLHVAMAGSVIADASMLSSLRARVYKFELKLIKQDEWLLKYTKWQPANMGDME